MKAIIIFNTKSGNTELLANKLKEILEKYKHNCEIYRDKKIKDELIAKPAFIKDHDLILLGSPVHFGGPAFFPFRKILKIIAELDLNDKKFMFFGTAGSVNRKGWRKIIKKIQKRMNKINYIGNIVCVKRDNKAALENFEDFIKNFK